MILYDANFVTFWDSKLQISYSLKYAPPSPKKQSLGAWKLENWQVRIRVSKTQKVESAHRIDCHRAKIDLNSNVFADSKSPWLGTGSNTSTFTWLYGPGWNVPWESVPAFQAFKFSTCHLVGPIFLLVCCKIIDLVFICTVTWKTNCYRATKINGCQQPGSRQLLWVGRNPLTNNFTGRDFRGSSGPQPEKMASAKKKEKKRKIPYRLWCTSSCARRLWG